MGLVLTGCYNKFTEPAPEPEMTDEIMELMGCQHKTIAEIKNMFGATSGTGSNGSLSDTVYKKFIIDESELTEYEKQNKRYIKGDYYIKGKVISNDEQGNVYKSLYIFDGTGAIELKLTNGLFIDYYCDLSKIGSGEDCTYWVYVKLHGLYLGNFRMMLSIGDVPTESFNAYGNYNYYANSNILSIEKVKEHVFRGAKAPLTEGTSYSNDVYVVNESNYSTITGSECPKYLGRLIRFKNLEVMYKGVESISGSDPALLNGTYDQQYPTWLCTSGMMIGGSLEYVVNRPWYKFAYTQSNVSLYCSLCVGYNKSAQYTSDAGIYTLRTSGYSRFANNYLPKHGVKGDVLAIFSIYSKQSTYSGGSRDYATYQLSACRFDDITFPMEPKKENPEWQAFISHAEETAPGYDMSEEDRTRAISVWKEGLALVRPAGVNEWSEWADWVIWVIENTPRESAMLPLQVNEDEE